MFPFRKYIMSLFLENDISWKKSAVNLTHLSTVSAAAGPQVGEPHGFLFGPDPTPSPAAPACFSICQRSVYFRVTGVVRIVSSDMKLNLCSNAMSALCSVCEMSSEAVDRTLWFPVICVCASSSRLSLACISSLCSSACLQRG